jgi:hypothetical protein
MTSEASVNVTIGEINRTQNNNISSFFENAPLSPEEVFRGHKSATMGNLFDACRQILTTYNKDTDPREMEWLNVINTYFILNVINLIEY